MSLILDIISSNHWGIKFIYINKIIFWEILFCTMQVIFFLQKLVIPFFTRSICFCKSVRLVTLRQEGVSNSLLFIGCLLPLNNRNCVFPYALRPIINFKTTNISCWIRLCTMRAQTVKDQFSIRLPGALFLTDIL